MCLDCHPPFPTPLISAKSTVLISSKPVDLETCQKHGIIKATPTQTASCTQPKYVATDPVALRVKQHSQSLSGGDFTISTYPTDDSPLGTKLFSVKGDFGSLSNKRHFSDTSGLPLFTLQRKKAGVTWFVTLPGDERGSEPIATIATKWSAFKDKFDVYFKNAAANGEETVLEVRGQNVWKTKTHVYYKGNLVMITKLADVVSVYVPGKRPAWTVEVAEGMDLSLASLITVLLATLLHYSSLPSSHSGPSSREDEDFKGISKK
ncbi:hypothetical protein IFM58399_01603 [Aspergillus lentulus]|uniref:uncharacterized protein n=1 Tax=Aspergillus lentulus TaxID=293939 RepID=UPI00139410F2|nr:uncharacterized protein IFM58399_01603 [Aspergillus lentulus]GFF27096.1 hypothetical protein IFM58399_01603 [Aspergillus lentulus]GFF46868.1 hypothetical protein IFM62136_00618 [Aspergillus lentulus]GFG14955.1 hypothetical protein IFM61392_08725 [Aspergillus lentulus]